MLFLELALIRWLGANVVHLSYFSNFVLLGSFLGIGIGFLISRKTWSVLPWTAPLLAVLVVVTLVFPVSIQREGSDLIYFTAMRVSGPPVWIALPVIFLLVAATLAGPAEVVGRCFGALPALTAYRYDLIGSLLGIASFTVLSFLWAPSVVWGVLVGLALVTLNAGALAAAARRYLRARPRGDAARGNPDAGSELVAVLQDRHAPVEVRVRAPCRSGSTGCRTRRWHAPTGD